MDKPIEERVLGEDAGEIVIASLQENCAAVDTLLGQARRKLLLFTRDLEPRVFDREEVYQAIRELATYSRYSEVRMLLFDSDRIVKDGHRLVDLARRLSSYIQIRLVPDDYKEIASSFMVVDDKGFLYRSLASQYEGVVDFSEPNRCRELTKLFGDVWEHSAPDPNLRRLHI
ncbi:MAG TPA: hypothetical protein VIX81_05610 [Gammaproteobacteria bacterium]